MKIKKITLKEYKRFSDTEIEELPEKAKLVILAGPNGSGKSSLFDALNTWRRMHSVGLGWDPSYFSKISAPAALPWNQSVKVEFHSQPANSDAHAKAVYVRSAYRNDPDFQVSSLNRTEPAIRDGRLSRLIENDAAVHSNYTRLAAQGLEDIFEKEIETTTIGEFREKTIGEIRRRLSSLFPDLLLNSLGNPLTSGTFKFDKGISKGFLYKNLSGGEKAAFDLLLDIIVKKREFDDTVFCIDEPEAHMNTRLQGALLRELYDLLPGQSQLWLATHSIGMMRAARDLASTHPDEVVFLDFGDRDFDKPQIIKPVVPSRQFWLKVLNVALDDLAELVAPKQVVICEGSPIGTSGRNTAIDARCFDIIFGAEYPDTQFLSGATQAMLKATDLPSLKVFAA